MASFPLLPSCLQLHVSLLPLVSTNPGLPAEVLFVHHPPHTALEEQMHVGTAVKMGHCSLAVPAAGVWQWRPRENKMNRRSFLLAYAAWSSSVSMSAGYPLQSWVTCPHRKIHRPFFSALNSGGSTWVRQFGSLRSNCQVSEKVLDCHDLVVRWQTVV